MLMLFRFSNNVLEDDQERVVGMIKKESIDDKTDYHTEDEMEIWSR